MNIVKVRFTSLIVAFDADRSPVAHRFHNPEQGLTIEVRFGDLDKRQAFINGSLTRDGVTSYAGHPSGHWAHSAHDLNVYISNEIRRITLEFDVEEHHCWPFIEQLPTFTSQGVSVNEALAFAQPIKDLLARGAPPMEIMNTLGVCRETIEFVIGGKLPPPRRLRYDEPDDDQQSEAVSW